MKWLLDRGIGTKQIMAFAVVVTLAIFLGVFALFKLAVVRATTVDMAEHRIPAIRSLSDLRAGLMQYNVAEVAYVFGTDADERVLRVSKMETGMATVKQAEADFEPLIDTADERKLYETIKQDIEQSKQETQTIMDYVAKSKTTEAVSEVTGNALGDFGQTMNDVQDEVDLKAKGAADATKASAKVYTASRWWIVVTLILVVLVSVLMVGTTTRLIAGPIVEVAKVVKRIAERDVTGEDLEVRSADEIGQLAGNVNLMQRTLREMIASMSTGAEQIATASEKFTAASHQISANSEETSAQATVVSDATEEINRNLRTVATSTEKMSASISEISKNATGAAKAAAEALRAATETNATVTKLDESSIEIGKVIKTITAIAHKTDLLALNATIEAARAGKAGQGFAVVANEVKELATQTAQATEDIGRQLAGIQEDARSAVEAIKSISAIISQVSDISAMIATAVEEQSATTTEMSRNVTEAVNGSTEVARNIAGVAQAAHSTSSGASDSQKAAEQLGQMSTRLHELVRRFKVAPNGDNEPRPSVCEVSGRLAPVP